MKKHLEQWKEENPDSKFYVLYVSPTNILKSRVEAENPDFKCITLSSLIGYSNSEGVMTNETNIDKLGVRAVIIDEIFMSSIKQLSYLARYIKKHPDIIFFCTGCINRHGGKMVETVPVFQLERTHAKTSQNTQNNESRKHTIKRQSFLELLKKWQTLEKFLEVKKNL